MNFSNENWSWSDLVTELLSISENIAIETDVFKVIKTNLKKKPNKNE